MNDIEFADDLACFILFKLCLQQLLTLKKEGKNIAVNLNRRALGLNSGRKWPGSSWEYTVETMLGPYHLFPRVNLFRT